MQEAQRTLHQLSDLLTGNALDNAHSVFLSAHQRSARRIARFALIFAGSDGVLGSTTASIATGPSVANA